MYVDGNRARLDLLALDPQGCWVVIEIKKGAVSRDTISQVIDYTACLAAMTEEQVLKVINPQNFGHEKDLRELLKERDALDSLDPATREVSMIVVGTDRSPELDRMADFLLGRFGIPLSIITFHVFSIERDTQVLVRELSEPEFDDYRTSRKSGSTPTLDELQHSAEQNGIGNKFKELRDVAEELGFHARPYKTSVMYTPQSKKSRCLFTVWVNPVENKIKVYLASGAFSEFFNVPEQRVEELLGENRWRYFDDQEVRQFEKGLKTLLADEN